MRVSRMYYEGPLQVGSQVVLPIETSHYITNVLRLKMGALVHLFNGDSNEYQARIISLQKKSVALTVESCAQSNNESPLKIHLVQAISRSEKMDWAIQKAVELGVTKITPIITDFCNFKPDEQRMPKRLNHWKKIISGACEQSGRVILPTLSPITTFDKWINEEMTGLKVFCTPGAEHSVASIPKQNEIHILIGPEGGLSESEILLAKNKGFMGLSLGPRILRTETAALTIIAIVQSLWGDLCK